MPQPLNSAKVLIKMHSRSGIWQAQRTTVQIHRDAAVEEYSIPTPQDVVERFLHRPFAECHQHDHGHDFEYVKEQAFQNALAWINSEDGPKNLSRDIQMEVQIAE